MRRALLSFFVIILIGSGQAYGHFGMIIPSDDIVSAGESTRLKLSLMFIHPFEGQGMPLAKPVQFGVLANNEKTDLIGSIKPVTLMSNKAFSADYKIRKPGVYSFYMEPQPYWEPAEDCYIVHYTKVILSAFGLEDGWDDAVGLKTEIVPLTRPFGLYAGNVFQGIVNVYGKPVPYAEVEIEYYNEDRQYTAPNDSFITQVVKADSNGVFTYAAPKPGWWGFAALNIDEKKIEGKDVEIGAVLWVKFSEMK
jgi:cobalt/nickel transport protein